MSSYMIGPFLVPADSHHMALARASLANSWLVTDYSADYPYAGRVCDYLFLFDPRPHYLIIVLSSCILSVCPLPDLLLTRFTLRVPRTIQPL